MKRRSFLQISAAYISMCPLISIASPPKMFLNTEVSWSNQYLYHVTLVKPHSIAVFKDGKEIYLGVTKLDQNSDWRRFLGRTKTKLLETRYRTDDNGLTIDWIRTLEEKT